MGPRSIPILFRWDVSTINPIRSGGVGGFFGYRRLGWNTCVLLPGVPRFVNLEDHHPRTWIRG